MIAWRTLVLLLLVPAAAVGQTVTQRGFAATRVTLFPLDAPNDSVNAVGDILVRDDVFVKPAAWIQFAAGAEVRANSHDQVENSWRVDVTDRRRLRPAISIRRASAIVTRGGLTIDAGKQFIRWGKADIVTPTDRFAPRDYLNVIDTDFIAVTGLRALFQRERNTFDAVWVPFFTPSRIPLLNQRWSPAPSAAARIVVNDAGAVIPGGSQAGVRWARVGDRAEYSLSYFDGFNHLPNIEVHNGAAPTRVDVIRRYPSLRSYGGDLAIPLPWFVAKGEVAYFTSSTKGTDEYALYVIQLERQTGEWSLVAGYAGEVVTKRRAALTFAPDRGLTRSVVARASYTIDANRGAAVETAVRQNGHGAYLKGEYSQARGQHWRATATGVVIAGNANDFLGQYRRNSNASLTLRYSF